MSDEAQRLGSRFAQQILKVCAEAATQKDLNAAEIAHHIMVNMLIELTTFAGEDNALLMVRKQSDGLWETHIHYDYLSAEHDHFKGDFDWGVSGQPPKDSP